MEKIISGALAATMGILSFTPQLIHAYQTKKTNDISWLFIWFNFIMCIIWIIYGYYADDLIVIITDVLIEVQVIILIGLKFHYDKKISLNTTTTDIL